MTERGFVIKSYSNFKQTALYFNEKKNFSNSANDKSINSLNISNRHFTNVKKSVPLTIECSKRIGLQSSKINSIQRKRRIQSNRGINTFKQSSNHNLLNLWSSLRRSQRCTEKLTKEKREHEVISDIINRKEKGMQIINTIDKGRGVESTIVFVKDSFIVEYAGDLVSEKDAKEREIYYRTDPNKGSYMFYFKYNDAKYCVDATVESGRFGRLLNHSKTQPNCYVKVILVDNVPRLTIFAKRDIDIGEELTYDYGDRDKCSIEANPWLKY